MANTNFGTLKSTFLRVSGNQYNSKDDTKLLLAGNCINRAIGIIQGEIKGHPYTMDTGNSIAAVFVAPWGTILSETNIIEVINTSQRSDPRKMTWIPYEKYLQYMADPARFAGIPSLMWTSLQALNVSGQNIWTLYFVPTPGSAITIYYDYIKNLLFSSDSSSANAEFSPFPSVFDGWIYDEAKPFLYEILDPKNTTLIDSATIKAEKSRIRYKERMLSNADGYPTCASARDRYPLLIKRVTTTNAI